MAVSSTGRRKLILSQCIYELSTVVCEVTNKLSDLSVIYMIGYKIIKLIIIYEYKGMGFVLGNKWLDPTNVLFSCIRGCIQKFPDSVDNEIYAYNNKHSLRSNTKDYGVKAH
jgi:hypothetical protein